MNIPHIHAHRMNIQTVNQNSNFPDVDLDRDLINPDEVVLGMKAVELSSDKRFSVNITTIVISALVFLIILAWFDFIQTQFYAVLYPPSTDDAIPASVKFWYAIMITIFLLILLILIYYHSSDQIK